MREVKVGQVYSDNDPRTVHQKLEVLKIVGDKAICQRGLFKVKILLRRLKNRGSRGYDLISEGKKGE